MSGGLESVIYYNTGAGMLIGRAWSLFRQNLKAGLLLILIPAILFALQGVFASIPSAFQTTATPSLVQIGFTLISIIGSVLLFTAATLAALLASLVLTRIFWSCLMGGKPISVGESLAFFRNFRVMAAILATSVVALALYVVFLLIDFFILTLGVMIASMVFGMVAGQIQQAGFGNVLALSAVSLIYMVIVGCLIMGLTLALLGVQILLLNFPFIALATGTGKHLMRDIGKSLRLFFANLPKAALFGSLLVVFMLVVYLVLTAPIVSIWVPFEMQRMQSAGNQPPGMLPFHVMVIINFWTSVLTVLSLPYMFAAFTLFWYDCRVNREGLDLRLWFVDLCRRRDIMVKTADPFI